MATRNYLVDLAMKLYTMIYHPPCQYLWLYKNNTPVFTGVLFFERLTIPWDL